MSIISKLSFGRQVATEIPADGEEVQKSELPVPSTGVASVTDSFESANSLQPNILTVTPQLISEDIRQSQPESVDASTLFENVKVQDPENEIVLSEQMLDRVSDRLTTHNTKMDIQKSESQDAEARVAKGYTDLDDLLKELRK